MDLVKEAEVGIYKSSVADPDPFDMDPNPDFRFDTDPDLYRFKEVMYLKQYFFYTS